jgi:hypothetical protein
MSSPFYLIINRLNNKIKIRDLAIDDLVLDLSDGVSSVPHDVYISKSFVN